METNIFRPISFGKEVFHPKSYDENSFIMDWTMEAGGMVPPHLHKYSDEHFTVTKGDVPFTVNGDTEYQNYAIEQAVDYCLELQNFNA